MRRAERFSARLPWEAQPEDAAFRRWVLGTSLAATLGTIVLALAPTPSPPVAEAPVAEASTTTTTSADVVAEAIEVAEAANLEVPLGCSRSCSLEL